MEHGEFLTKITSYNADGDEYHSPNVILVKWGRVEDGYFFTIELDGTLIEKGTCKDLTDLWLYHVMVARLRVK